MTTTGSHILINTEIHYSSCAGATWIVVEDDIMELHDCWVQFDRHGRPTEDSHTCSRLPVELVLDIAEVIQ